MAKTYSKSNIDLVKSYLVMNWTDLCYYEHLLHFIDIARNSLGASCNIEATDVGIPAKI